MNIVVTGANGFVGRRVVDQFVAAGHRVVAVGRGIGRQDCAVLDARFDRCDWRQIGPIDLLLHFAAINDTSVRDEAEIRRVNVDMALECMGDAIAAGCRRIVYASSLHVYGKAAAPMAVDRSTLEPLSLYGQSKLDLERGAAVLAARHGIGCVGLRFANVYGPGEGHKGRMASQVLQIAKQMRNGEPEIFAPGTQVRDFVYVDDAAAAAVKAALLTDPAGPSILNCGSGEGTSFNDLVGHLNAALGLNRAARYVPEPPGYLSRVVLDIEKTTGLLDWHPRGIVAGIAAYLDAGELAGSGVDR